MKKKVVFAIFVLLLLVSCTPRRASCDIVLTDNHVAVDGTYIVTEEEQDLARELEMNVRLALYDSVCWFTGKWTNGNRDIVH